jgi:uncharacterized membrane protein
MTYLSYHINPGLCIRCNQNVSSMIQSTFKSPGILIILSSLVIIGLIVALFYYLSVKKIEYYRYANAHATLLNPIPFTFASLILGVGIGGFIDGIVFHQILQWHGMLTNQLPPNTVDAKSINMFWDGMFHIFTLLVVLTGVIALWKVSRLNYVEKSGKLLMGGLLSGWGIFNLLEGLINHHIFNLHNVRDNVADGDYYNYAFLLFSAILLFVGALIISKYYVNIFKPLRRNVVIKH